MKFSPLFWPVELKKDAIYILDETALPRKVSYIKARTCRESCRAIKDMKTRAVGQVLLVMCTFLLVARQNKNKRRLFPVLVKAAEAINAARPTLPFKVLTDMVMGWARAGAPLEQAIGGFLQALRNKRIQQAREAAALFSDGDCILTHCNVSGLLPLIADICREEGRRISFFATETRPYLQGSRLTAWELHRAGHAVTVITDGMAAQVMSEGKIASVIVGADNLARNGDIANKIGTYQIAIAAKYFNIPLYVVCPPPSEAGTGADIRIEVRPDAEVLRFNGLSIAPKGVKAYYPAFDVTPHYLITKHIYLKLQ